MPDATVPKRSSIQTHPNLEDTARLFEGPLGIRSISLTGLFILACFYTLYFARAFFLPATLAIVFMFLLAPVVRALTKRRVPAAIGSAIVIVALLASSGFLAFELSGPLTEWLEKAPEMGAQLQSKIQPLRRYFVKIASTSDQVEKLTRATAESPKAPQQVELKQTSLLGIVFNGTSKALFSLLVVIVLLYFLLASGDLFLVEAGSRVADSGRQEKGGSDCPRYRG